VSAVESVLEAQTTALLRRLAREQETRTRRIRDEAGAQAADVVRRARSEARSRVRQAVLETRRGDETTLDQLQVELDPQWVPELGAALVQSFTGDSTVNVVASEGLGAGLRIRAGDACLDATVAGLLAARERIAAELLAEFERQVAARRAEHQP